MLQTHATYSHRIHIGKLFVLMDLQASSNMELLFGRVQTSGRVEFVLVADWVGYLG